MYTFNDVTKYLDSLLVREKIPGFDCKVFHKGKEVYRHTGGYNDKENKIPMKGNESYFLYSCSKVICVSAALHAFEEGRYLMGEPLWWYLPEFKNCKVKEYDKDGSIYLADPKRPILIQDLFGMKAGFNYDTSNEEIRRVVEQTNGKAPTREVMRAIARMNLDFHPGEHFKYSLCHDVLAGFIEVVTGKRFSEYVDEVIFKPLGMTNSKYHPTESDIANMAQQYIHNYETGEADLHGKRNGYVFGEEYDSGGAGVVSTIEDLGKFACALANGGVGANGARILSKSTIKLMRTNILTGRALDNFQEWDTNREYGYGYGVRTKIGEGLGGSIYSIGEFGWDGAAGSLISIDPEREIAIVYTQHMLNPLLNITHPRLKTLVHLALGY